MKKILITMFLLIAVPSLIFAQDSRIIVKDDGGDDVFTVQDTGVVFAGGEDSRNAFQLLIGGHTGGDTHAQIVTNSANSRLTILAGLADDAAPRMAAISSADGDENVRGWLTFDYGSKLVDLPEAQFKVRYYDTGGITDMIVAFDDDAVTFPTGNVGIATTNPQYLLQVTDAGAYCDGTNWVDVSSRDAKDNILELKTEEALETLKHIKPVKFSYKQDADKETNVGFIAEDVPDLVATKGRKGMVSMEVVAVLTKVVQQQQEMIAKLSEEVKSLKVEVVNSK